MLLPEAIFVKVKVSAPPLTFETLAKMPDWCGRTKVVAPASTVSQKCSWETAGLPGVTSDTRGALSPVMEKIGLEPLSTTLTVLIVPPVGPAPVAVMLLNGLSAVTMKLLVVFHA